MIPIQYVRSSLGIQSGGNPVLAFSASAAASFVHALAGVYMFTHIDSHTVHTHTLTKLLVSDD